MATPSCVNVVVIICPTLIFYSIILALSFFILECDENYKEIYIPESLVKVNLTWCILAWCGLASNEFVMIKRNVHLMESNIEQFMAMSPLARVTIYSMNAMVFFAHAAFGPPHLDLDNVLKCYVLGMVILGFTLCVFNSMLVAFVLYIKTMTPTYLDINGICPLSKDVICGKKVKGRYKSVSFRGNYLGCLFCLCATRLGKINFILSKCLFY
eukprot:716146_1